MDIPQDSTNGFPLLSISNPDQTFDDLIISAQTKEILKYVVSENKSAEKLHSFGLRPKNRILLCGPPGTGKTLTAKIISCTVGYPLAHVMFDSTFSSFLGETATNLRKIFDFIESGKYVVLFDEFDIVGKKRDDTHEHGEIKRIVNNFMSMLDGLGGYSIVIAATNHQHLLDTALWRRFDEIIYFDLPDAKKRKALFEKYLDSKMNVSMIKSTGGYSAADIAQICNDARRKSIICNEKTGKDHIAWAVSQQKLRKKAVLGT